MLLRKKMKFDLRLTNEEFTLETVFVVKKKKFTYSLEKINLNLIRKF